MCPIIGVHFCASPCFTLFLKDLQKTGWIDRTRNELKRGKHTPTQTAVSPKVHQRPRKLSPSAEFKQKLKSFDFEFDKAERKPTPPPSIPNELSPYIEELIDLYNSGNWKDMNARREFLLKLAKLEVAK
ncbi:hypothetical protein L1D14_07480 [Vibrio tubiashii]|uniref:hypothetical protein n=1 Tax=Vibrio tubiashii TaxID=29498 RepID=UPI001EFDC864|nr:hypothetical protein [Vibrio tubiashii]MCG9576079.1 hypothetical protein [Vibrio tubiashii]